MIRKKIVKGVTRGLKDSEIVDVLTQRNYNYNRGVLKMGRYDDEVLDKAYGRKGMGKQLEANYQKFKRKEID